MEELLINAICAEARMKMERKLIYDTFEGEGSVLESRRFHGLEKVKELTKVESSKKFDYKVLKTLGIENWCRIFSSVATRFCKYQKTKYLAATEEISPDDKVSLETYFTPEEEKSNGTCEISLKSGGEYYKMNILFEGLVSEIDDIIQEEAINDSSKDSVLQRSFAYFKKSAFHSEFVTPYIEILTYIMGQDYIDDIFTQQVKLLREDNIKEDSNELLKDYMEEHGIENIEDAKASLVEILSAGVEEISSLNMAFFAIDEVGANVDSERKDPELDD